MEPRNKTKLSSIPIICREQSNELTLAMKVPYENWIHLFWINWGQLNLWISFLHFVWIHWSHLSINLYLMPAPLYLVDPFFSSPSHQGLSNRVKHKKIIKLKMNFQLSSIVLFYLNCINGSVIYQDAPVWRLHRLSKFQDLINRCLQLNNKKKWPYFWHCR